MKMMSGIIHTTSGRVSVLGFNPFDRKKEFLSKIGLVMGNKSGLNWDLTARQSFELTQFIYKIPKEIFNQRIDELTGVLEVKDLLDNQVRKLSLGERMKFEIINAILHNPEILFLDEPTIGLDIISKKNIREFLRKIQSESNITIILTSHNMDDVEKVCDRVIIINEGAKIFDDSMEVLKKNVSDKRYVTFIFENNPKIEELSKFGEITEFKDQTATHSTSQKDMPKLIDQITSNYPLLDIDISSTPLEEIIEGVFKGK
jgi:ABC-2 type transport system ATP-binding protein